MFDRISAAHHVLRTVKEAEGKTLEERVDALLKLFETEAVDAIERFETLDALNGPYFETDPVTRKAIIPD